MPYHILLANDDGIESPGLYEMCVALCEKGFDVTVAAPKHERSGAGHAITILNPLWAHPYKYYNDVPAYAIDGTPADCVKLGVRTLARFPVDLVVSGINNGENVGKDTHYSGTVSAAIEGLFCGVPSMAVSIASHMQNKDYRLAAETGANLALWLIENPLPLGTMLNLNVPNLPKSEIKGIRWTSLSSAAYNDDYEERSDPRGRKYYWICGAYEKKIPQGADLDLLQKGYITLTPLTWDMTDHAMLEKMREIEDEFQIYN